MQRSLISIVILFSTAASAEYVNLEVDYPLFGTGESARLYVDCIFDERLERCFLDTGARQSQVPLDPHFMKYPVASKGQAGGASGEKIDTEEVRIGEVRVGPASVKNLLVDRLSNPVAGGPLIGGDFLRHLTLTFDFSLNQLHFENQKPSSRPEFAMSVYKNVWAGIPVTIGSVSTEALWDTGASMTVVDEKLVAAHPEKFIYLREEQGTDGFKTWTTKIYKTSLTMGGEELINVSVVAIDLSVVQKGIDANVQAIVGFNAYSKFNWLIDYKNRRWALWQ